MTSIKSGSAAHNATTLSGGVHSLPWWADALFALLALVILITLVWAIVELVRWITAGERSDEHPAAQP